MSMEEPKVSTPKEVVDNEDMTKKKRLEDLKKLKEKFSKVSRYNNKAVEMEAKRLKSDSYVDREERAEWAASKRKEQGELKRKGITEKNSYMVESADKAEKLYEKRKQKEENRIRSYGWNVFGEDAIYRGYEKRLKNLPTTPESVAASDENRDPTDEMGVNVRLSEEAINRVVEDQKMIDEKNKSFSKRRTYHLQHKVDYINERNRVYNRKLDRYFDRYTTDIRANLERGTAL
ncbi:hypothetical protein JH06_3438 [Blastocystis sp. subtype 4]|uniref:hypothetical protein n=1 Tax=Blastocystis sp. subtype 4 TaxID=944170 RepID=UPI000711967E|nr:hypothetical protein JH06_3438 [Blastocystis sp. subtype 4]KNB43191.1 hypothetical protein JH06_3438 [Blastocystis sp. subtype 4]|eukprot:XP_014526634.1 hypothetical protein JH06_3438 [Blastocystis sp. subtype 4]